MRTIIDNEFIYINEEADGIFFRAGYGKLTYNPQSVWIVAKSYTELAEKIKERIELTKKYHKDTLNSINAHKFSSLRDEKAAQRFAVRSIYYIDSCNYALQWLQEHNLLTC